MHRNTTILVAIAVVALSACGRKPEQAAASGPAVNYTVKDADGATAHVTAGAPAAGAKLPSYAPLYPGAVIVSSITGASGTGSGGTVMFTTKAKPAEIVAFYQQAAKTAGFGATFSSQTGNGLMFSAGKDGGEEGLQVIATPTGAETTVQVFWTDPKKG